MIDRSLWDDDELEIIDFYGGKCIKCRHPFVTLHEIVPKSQLPKDWKREGNRVPVCVECHDYAHRIGTRKSRPEFIELRDKFNGRNSSN